MGSRDIQNGIGVEIAERIAEVGGGDPLELDPPLQSVIDIDALDALVADSRQRDSDGNLQVTFAYHQYEVLVECGDGAAVEVRELE